MVRYRIRSVFTQASLLLALGGSVGCPCVAGESTQLAELAARGPLEKRALFTPEEVKEWPGEECTTDASTAHVKDAANSLHWHVPVDYTAGEKKYPVGWPRFGRALKAGPQRDWSDWDYVHGWIFVETSRASLPREPAGIGINAAGDHADYHRALTELKQGAWAELLIPVSQLARPDDVRRLQFHISESNYDHGDTIDFYISDLALLRYAQPALLEFSPDSTVMYADATHLSVQARLAGVKPGDTCALRCERRRAQQVVASLATQAVRGAQRLTLDLGRTALLPGDYELRATVAANPKPVTAKLRLVESPWK